MAHDQVIKDSLQSTAYLHIVVLSSAIGLIGRLFSYRAHKETEQHKTLKFEISKFNPSLFSTARLVRRPASVPLRIIALKK